MMDLSIKNVDDYLAKQPEKNRTALSKLRVIIRKLVPEAEEKISYGMPMYKYHGMLVGFAGYKNHLGFYPGAIVGKFADELKDFKISKGTIQFGVDKPIPDELLIRIIKARIDENLERAKEKNK
jgi:uncharacterized protein YdhG (YjbR/CyaY superfamily)